MKFQKFICLSVLLALSIESFTQQLKPGFDKQEYLNLLKISAQFGDSSYRAAIPVPEEYTLGYRSPVMGLDNMWELYTENSEVAIIKFITRVLMNHAYNKLYKPTRRAQRNYQKILGDITSRSVQKAVPGFVPPAYYSSSDYVRTGTTIVLQADEEYFDLYPNDREKIFQHHFHPPYLMLAEKLKLGPSSAEAASPSLEGKWEMVYISGRRIAFEGLYPEKKPFLQFDLSNQRVSGNTGCNSFSGSLVADADSMDLSTPFAITKMMCQGEGERIFLETIKEIKAYQLVGDTLSLIANDLPLMRFVKKH